MDSCDAELKIPRVRPAVTAEKEVRAPAKRVLVEHIARSESLLSDPAIGPSVAGQARVARTGTHSLKCSPSFALDLPRKSGQQEKAGY